MPFNRLLPTLVLLLCALAAPPTAWAAMTIEIVGAAANRIPVAVVPFEVKTLAASQDPAEVVAADLGRSGLMRVLNERQLPAKPSQPDQVEPSLWRAAGADALVYGQVVAAGEGQVELRFWLYDVVRQNTLAAMSLRVTPGGVRAAAHRIADIVHEKLIGEPGAYSGRIAYIVKNRGAYELQVADADSQNAFTVARSAEPIISPAWSPDGARLAYVTFEHKKPVVYVQRLADGRRYALAMFRGSNSAPAWSPDGRRLAVALSKDDASQLYLIDADGGEPMRLTHGGALDTEPVFSPDGQWLYFTSDRGGTPQIYRLPLNGGQPQRVTFDGGYNVSPALSPDGKQMAFVHRRDGRFQIAVMDLASGNVRVLTDTSLDESPSFAPNGRGILYATLVNGRGVLATVSVDGSIRQRLSQAGDLREPVWGP
jgi:TolB protein